MKIYLQDVVDFSKGYLGSKEIRDRFVDFFIEVFLEQIKEDNAIKVKSLVEIHPSAYEVLVNLEKQFMDTYSLESSIDSEESRQMFKKLMRNYFI